MALKVWTLLPPVRPMNGTVRLTEWAVQRGRVKVAVILIRSYHESLVATMKIIRSFSIAIC